jgi:MFS transporter, DHA2 family, multidrug resistance protein
MCALQVVLDKGQENDWFASSLITDLSITAALALPAFVIWELRRADPIVDLRLFANRGFAVGNLLMFMLGFVLLGSTVLLPLFV